MAAMSAPLLMLLASLLFALMARCVKLASAHYGAGEIVLYRSLIGLTLMAAVLRERGTSLKTPVPAMHFWRSLAATFLRVRTPTAEARPLPSRSTDS